jgi:uncharacterized protein YdhG (YjbR/CyaY superfamily)
VRAALPKTAVEGISYGIPTYKMDARPVIYFAGWKSHCSLYPLDELVTETLAKELEPYDVEKGTVRFPYTARLPTHLIQRIAKLRVEATAMQGSRKRRAESAAKSSRRRSDATRVKARGTKPGVKSKPRGQR